MKPNTNDIKKIQKCIEDNNLDCYIGNYDGDLFLVVSSLKEEKIIQKLFKRRLDKVIDFGYDDEYTTCSECGNIICLTPSYYGNIGNYIMLECEILCRKCATFEVMEDVCKNNYRRADTMFDEDDFIDHGYTKYNAFSYENGWYDGQNDKPEKIYKELESKYATIIFRIDRVGQFDTHFSAWVKDELENEDE